MNEQSLAETIRQSIQQTRSLHLGAFSMLYPILERLGLREIVNIFRPTEADLDLGLVVLVLVLNRLMAPAPLSWVDLWLAQGAVAAAAVGVTPSKLYDQRLGRALDAIFPGRSVVAVRSATM